MKISLKGSIGRVSMLVHLPGRNCNRTFTTKITGFASESARVVALKTMRGEMIRDFQTLKEMVEQYSEERFII